MADTLMDSSQISIPRLYDFLRKGHVVVYRVILLRGYTTGPSDLTFHPSDRFFGEQELTRRVRNFRNDSFPFELPFWIIKEKANAANRQLVDNWCNRCLSWHVRHSLGAN